MSRGRRYARRYVARHGEADDFVGHHPYMQFEARVIEQAGGSVAPDAIRKHNEAIRGFHHSDELAARMRQAAGITDASIKDAVTLNAMEDLDEIHRQVTA